MRIGVMRIQTGSTQTTSRGGLKWIESTSWRVSVQSRACTRRYNVSLAFARAPVMPGDWSYEQTRSLVGVWSQTNVQGECDGVTRNPVVFERIA